MKTSVREGKWCVNHLYFHVICSVKLSVTYLKDVTDIRKLVKIPWQSWDKGDLRSAWRCFVRSYGPLVTRVWQTDKTFLIGPHHHLSLPLWANCMTGTHVTLETTYSTSVENKSESLRVSEVSVTKKISCYTPGGRDCYPKNKSMDILAVNTAHCATDQSNNLLLRPKHQYDKMIDMIVISQFCHMTLLLLSSIQWEVFNFHLGNKSYLAFFLLHIY